MFLITFIAGLVLLLAGQDWFSGAETVGWILLAVTIGLALIQAGAAAVLANSIW